MTNIDLGCVNEMKVPAEAPRHAQAPGFQRVRIGDLLITALYDGFVPVLADDLHGGTPAEVSRLPAEASMPADGDRRTAVIAFLVEDNGRHILIDAGSSDSVGAPPSAQAALGRMARQVATTRI